MSERPQSSSAVADGPWETGTDEKFFDYYARQSLSASALARFASIKSVVVRNLSARQREGDIAVADVGCGAGSLSFLWTDPRHKVHGIDVSEALIELAQKRAREGASTAEFTVGSATELPWADASMDVVLIPELLEHVTDWESAVDEAVRVLKPDGLLYLSTTNRLCPKQAEYELPMYSWYPAFLKRRYERLAVTTRPELVNHAKYPAVHWFTYYQLAAYLAQHGFTSMDRFDLARQVPHGRLGDLAFRLICAVPGARFLGQIATPYSAVLARKAS